MRLTARGKLWRHICFLGVGAAILYCLIGAALVVAALLS